MIFIHNNEMDNVDAYFAPKYSVVNAYSGRVIASYEDEASLKDGFKFNELRFTKQRATMLASGESLIIDSSWRV